MADMNISVARLWRLAPWSGNPLMRPSDRLESLSILFVALVLAMLVPLAGAVGTSTYSGLSDASRQVSQTNRQVPAVLLGDAPSPQARGTGMYDRARAEWSVDGTPRTGLIHVDGEIQVGRTVDIWIDPEGNYTEAPSTGAENAFGAVGAALMFWAFGSAGCVLVLLAVHSLANRYRLRCWQREWDTVGQTRGWSLN
ncbi:Rv1733c family protein [Rhodococcus xishaensis]|nr:hypothetical protein [Rhodococcus xishaensis]